MEPGQNIILTTVIEPKRLKLSDGFILSAAVALACFDLFSAYALDETKIKWPNDIYWKDRKAGGILIENILQGAQWKFAIVGIGININQTTFPDHLPNPVSLKQITGKTYDPVELAHQLCNNLEKRWQQIKANDFAAVVEEYNSCMYKLNSQVKFKKGNATFSATVEGVNKNGELLVFTNVPTAIPYGEWEWKVEQG
jgi:BirA family biotin operon repressor/biotin-[acetyl-CoA-carboxylase] ligase